jgi:predicted RNA binding protein YcfA (HicA-like mRNA interferase family)
MKSLSSAEIIEILSADGWFHVATAGSHHHFKHATKPGRVTVPHPRKDVPRGTARNIFRQAGLDPP